MLRMLVDGAGHYADTCRKALRDNGHRYEESAVNEYADAVLGLYSEHTGDEDFAKSVDAARRNCHEKIQGLNSVNWREAGYFNKGVTDALKAFADAVSSAANKCDRPDAFQKRPVAPLQPRTSLLTERLKAYDDAALTYPEVNRY